MGSTILEAKQQAYKLAREVSEEDLGEEEPVIKNGHPVFLEVVTYTEEGMNQFQKWVEQK
jgi:hypothetical protein